MYRPIIAVMTAGLLVGCQAGASFDPQSGRQSESDQTQLAAYAASSQYPRDAEPSDDLRAAALINRGDNTIRILNFGDRPLNDAVVWVNGAFVGRAASIPPNGSITLSRTEFYDATGRSLASQATSANRVQIQWADQLYNLQGPVYE